MYLRWRRFVQSVCFEILEGRIYLSETLGEWEDNDPVVVFCISKFHKCREKGWVMHSKNISVVNILANTLWLMVQI
jgi:hypothetical protein